jgi:hypothetical protein
MEGIKWWAACEFNGGGLAAAESSIDILNDPYKHLQSIKDKENEKRKCQ